MTRSVLRLVLTASIGILAVVPALFGQAPDSVSFQGYLTNPGGDPINQAGVNMTFKLYKNSVAVWTESQSVDVVGGVFNVLLGKTSALDTMAFNAPIELGITVGGDPEISPRTPLAAAPYAKALPGLYTVYRENSPFRAYNVIGGGPYNELAPNVVGATISGGGGYGEGGVYAPNKVLNDFATVGGGYTNIASGLLSTVGGGRNNQAVALESVVSGGRQNSATENHATVSGGIGNEAGERASIGGGAFNVASGNSSTVSGGASNDATGNSATVSGGSFNKAEAFGATVVGGSSNTAEGLHSVVLGGVLNRASGISSLAAGHNAKAEHDGTFIWNDQSSFNSNDSIASTGVNQFIIRASGGVALGTNQPRAMLTLQGPEDRIMGPSIFFRGDNSDQYESGRIRFVEGTGLSNHRGAYIHYQGSEPNALYFGVHNTTDSLSANDVNVVTIRRAGGVAIGTTEDPGNHQLRIQSSGTNSSGSTLEAKNTSTAAGVAARFETNGTDATVVTTQNGTGDIIKAFGGGFVQFRVHVNGDVTAEGAFTGGGADVAEAFDVAGDNDAYEPGDVMVISTATDRTVEKSQTAYSSRIAGVYATKPGVLLSDLGMRADLSKKIPLAIVGVVPTKVTAENGPIRRGDMLVTSSTLGHAMAANHEDVGVGTVIGKALENFDGPGEGLIEVLVSMK